MDQNQGGEETSQAPEHSTADYENYQPPAKPPRRLKKPLIITGIILLVIIVGLAGYQLAKKKPAAQNSKNSTSSSQTQTATPAKTVIKPNTKNYASQNFALSFDYPEDWTVTDQQGSGIMTVKSPALSLTDSSGQAFSGQIIMTFRAKTQKLTEFDAGAATTVTDSKKIAYTKPTQNQRGETYLSYLRYAKTTGSSALDAIYITGNNGYKKDQDVPLADMTKVDPVVSITFAKCADSSCGKPTATSVSATVLSDTSLYGPLEKMLQSLTIS